MSENDDLKRSEAIKKLEEEYDKQQATYKKEGKEEHYETEVPEEEQQSSLIHEGGALLKTGADKIKELKEGMFGDILPF